MKTIIVLLVVLVVLGSMIYVRLSPDDAAFWHRMPAKVADRDFKGGAMRVLSANKGQLARLDEIIMATPRTKRLAGSVDEGMITYVTRSAFFGFPDYTTVRQGNDQIEIYGRLRYGASDLGVNARRVDGWLGTLAQGG